MKRGAFATVIGILGRGRKESFAERLGGGIIPHVLQEILAFMKPLLDSLG